MARVWCAVVSLLTIGVLVVLGVGWRMALEEERYVQGRAATMLLDACRSACLEEYMLDELEAELLTYEVTSVVLRRVGPCVRLREVGAAQGALQVGDEIILECVRREPSLLGRLLYALGRQGDGGLLGQRVVVQGMVIGEGGY